MLSSLNKDIIIIIIKCDVVKDVTAHTAVTA